MKTVTPPANGAWGFYDVVYNQSDFTSHLYNRGIETWVRVIAKTGRPRFNQDRMDFQLGVRFIKAEMRQIKAETKRLGLTNKSAWARKVILSALDKRTNRLV